MEPLFSPLEPGIEHLRPVLMTLAEVFISPAYRVELDASDVVQQTFLEAHEQGILHQRLGEQELFGWLRVALRHNILDAVRSLNSKKRDVKRCIREADINDSFARIDEMLVADDTSPPDVIARNEQLVLLMEMIQRLPEGQKQAVILKHFRGFSLQQIAESLGSTESAVAGLLDRGRKQLEKYMKRTVDEPS